MSYEEDKQQIRAFLIQSFHHYEIQDDESIFSLGFVNSLFAMELVLFVEKTFGITVENEDLDIENFQTVNALATLVARKTRKIREKDLH